MSRSTFGKYVLLRKLASGGMGEVFLAKQRGPSGFEKLLVIKRILSHHLDKRDYLDMFFSEAKLVARLNHNNIIQIQEMGEIDGDYYIAMEYVRGKSLRDIIDELRAEGRMLPLPHVIDLAIKLCEGLGYAHQARDIRGRPMNIVHRDINPHNVLCSYNGDLKLIDFGIAKSEMTSVHTATGTIKGKFVYMSPEQSAADPIDRRSDIFSLGIVLYEMTVLENPFVRQNVVLSLEAIQRHAIPPPSSKRADAAPLDTILTRALEKRPEDRYQTATEMRDDLRNLFRTTIVQPADEDISIFLHELFRADIDEEDRLLAEADRATTPPAGTPSAEGPTLAQFDQPPSASIGEMAAYERHSSDEQGANPTSAFGDEEPTLSGNLEGYAQRSREISHSKPADANGSGDIVPGEEMSEHPTRSDRIPGRKNSVPPMHEAPAISTSGPLMPLPSSPSMSGPLSGPIAGSLNPIPAAAIGNGISLPTRASSSPPPHIAVTGELAARRPAVFDEPINGSVHEPTREMRSGESLAPYQRTPPDRPGAVGFQNVAITDEDNAALSQPTPPWRRVGLWVAGLLVFLATAVAGFVATRAVTRSSGGPRSDLEQVLPAPIGEEQPSAPIDVNGVKVDDKLPALSPAPDPQEKEAEPIKQAIVAEEPPKVEEAVVKALSPKEEKKRKAEAAKLARDEEKRKKAEEAAVRAEEKKRKAEAERARDDERRKNANVDKSDKTAPDQERRKKAAEDKAARDEEKRRKAEADKAAKREKADAEKAAREEAKRVKAEADKAAREDEKRKKAEAKEALDRAKAAAEDADKRESEKKSESTGRRVVVPGDQASNDGSDTSAARDAKDAKDGNAKDAVLGDSNVNLAAKAKEKPDATPSRFGTLTVSTSVEVNVELDGKPVGTSPSVIQVKKPQGKIKLFGPGVEIAVMLTYKVEDNGISVKLDSNPWAIAKHNGLSLGKTPQNIPAEPRHRFSLLRPGQVAPFVISLLWNAKSGG